jgi:protein-S-isoprenylcysteine O-methyltransferase Ste14
MVVLLYEEPNLRRKFGDAYAHYTASVHRWIPGHAYRNPKSG